MMFKPIRLLLEEKLSAARLTDEVCGKQYDRKKSNANSYCCNTSSASQARHLLRKEKALVLCFLLLLTACQSKEPTQRALDFRTALLESGGCGFTADISADYGDRVYDFTVTCDYAAGEGARIEVLQPEEIVGIAAQVSPDGAKVIFDGVELDFGQLAEGNVSPMAASWLLGHCWTEAYTDSAGTDGDLYRITHLEGYNDEELTVDTWLDDTQTPIHAEIAYDGTRCLNIDISDFYLKT